jgi:hypothetical protein
VSLEDQYAIALGVLCVLLLAVGTLGARRLSHASARVVRVAWPVTAVTTAAIFAIFVFIARNYAH